MTEKKQPQKKYVLLVIKIQNGEYEYYSYGTHQLDPEVDLTEWADDYVKDFYGGKSYEDDGWYYFFGGEVAACVYSIKEMTLNEYEVFRNFGI